MAQMFEDDGVAPETVARFVERWEKSGGAERSNTHSFINELCDLLGLPHPDPVTEANHLNDYVYERSVTRHHADGHVSTRYIDLYKRGAFVLEAKQSAKAGKAKPAGPGPGFEENRALASWHTPPFSRWGV